MWPMCALSARRMRTAHGGEREREAAPRRRRPTGDSRNKKKKKVCLAETKKTWWGKNTAGSAHRCSDWSRLQWCAARGNENEHEQTLYRAGARPPREAGAETVELDAATPRPALLRSL